MYFDPLTHIDPDLKNEFVPKQKFLVRLLVELFLLRFGSGAEFVVIDNGIDIIIKRNLKWNKSPAKAMKPADIVRRLWYFGVREACQIVYFSWLNPETVKKYIAEIKETDLINPPSMKNWG